MTRKGPTDELGMLALDSRKRPSNICGRCQWASVWKTVLQKWASHRRNKFWKIRSRCHRAPQAQRWSGKFATNDRLVGAGTCAGVVGLTEHKKKNQAARCSFPSAPRENMQGRVRRFLGRRCRVDAYQTERRKNRRWHLSAFLREEILIADAETRRRAAVIQTSFPLVPLAWNPYLVYNTALCDAPHDSAASTWHCTSES